MTIGERIKMLRKTRGMNAETLAEKLGVAASTIYRYEKGEIMKVSIESIPPIAQALGVSPAALMGWEDLPEMDEKITRINVLAEQLTEQNLDIAADVLEGLIKRQ